MATEYLLTRGADTLRVVLADSELIVGEGEHAIVQSFDDHAAARAHLDYMISRRRRAGYATTSRDIGPLDGAEGGAPEDQFEFERGRLKVVFTDDAGLQARCEALTAAAGSRQAVCLQLICDLVSPGELLSTALSRRTLPAVRRLIFDTPFQTVTRQRDQSPGDLAAIFAALPNLEDAFLTGDIELRPVTHPRLRALYLLGDPLPPASLAGLRDSHLPALERLALCLSRDDEPASGLAVAASLRALQAPHLTHIDISGADDLVALLEALCAQGIPDHWSTLSLQGIVHDEDALLAALEASVDALAGLDRLALPLSDDLSLGAAERASALIPCIIDREELPDLLLPSVYEDW